MFDAVSYQKGGRILHMLRNVVGDSAFFKSLNLYLKTNAFKPAEAHQLRLAFEEVTGEDLNWFFNQWYFGDGYPKLDVNYNYNDAAKTVTVNINQTQESGKIFQLPIDIDVYAGGKKERHLVTITDKTSAFTFPYTSKPDLVNVDADKVLLADINDQRDLNTYIFQYYNAPTYLDRREALEACLKEQANPAARKVVIAALKDKFYGIRSLAIKGLSMSDDGVKSAALPVLQQLAKDDKNALVRTAALKQLGSLRDAQYSSLFEAATKDQSYAAAGAALTSLSSLNADKAYTLAKQMEASSRGALRNAIAGVYAKKGNEDDVAFFAKTFDEASGQEKVEDAIQYITILANVDNADIVIKGIGQIKDMTKAFNNKMVTNYMVNMLQPVAKRKLDKATIAPADKKADLMKQYDYLKKVITELKD